MTDRELLELAAKAAGIDGIYTNEFCAIGGGGMSFLEGLEYLIEGSDCVTALWNPLTDDGDALRLAVKLQTPIEWDTNEVFVDYCVAEYEDNDPYAATRRAIVRAAAEIGKGMK